MGPLRLNSASTAGGFDYSDTSRLNSASTAGGFKIPPLPPSASNQRIESPVSFRAYMMCAFASFAGVMFGYDSGYISAVLGMEAFKRDYGHQILLAHGRTGWIYDTWEKSLVVSILSAGTFIGALLSGWLADRIGRRTTIIGPGCILFIIGVIVQVATNDIAGFASGRFTAGLGVGCVSAVTILYLSEVAPRKVRGAIVSAYQFAITLGILMASCVGYATQNRTDSGAYRIPIALQFLWALILAVGLFLLPESPRYYVKINKLDKAATALASVRGQMATSTFIEDELAEIVASCQYEQQVGEVSWLGCFSGGIARSNSNIRKVFIGTALQMFQQWTGINFIFYYNVTFFQQVGLNDPFLISMVTAIVNVVSTPVAFFAIEKFGRRALLIYGAFAMCVCEFVIATVGVSASRDNDVTNYILIAFVCIYVFFFAASWGPTAWVIVGEIFQLPIRSKGVALSTASNWFWNCVIAIIIPFIVDPDKGDLGVRVFFVWGSTCALCAGFAWCFVPETRGLTLEQVDKMMDDVPAYDSSRWQPLDTWDFPSPAFHRPDAGYQMPMTTPPPSSHGNAPSPTVASFIDMHR